MGLNKQKGNMYPWVTHTWNVIKGKCSHDCNYCYMKRFPLNDIRFDDGELNTNLGQDNKIFVGSSCDMWANSISDDWIKKVLMHCNKYQDNGYLFQTKNPKRFYDFIDKYMPIVHWSKAIMFGVTIETNRDTSKFSNAPVPNSRVPWMWEFTDKKYDKYQRMISIEPIMDFDINEFYLMVHNIQPHLISIGADSKGHKLPEPDKDKLLEFIELLKKKYRVELKDNLRRI